jgi:hypothetical protein
MKPAGWEEEAAEAVAVKEATAAADGVEMEEEIAVAVGEEEALGIATETTAEEHQVAGQTATVWVALEEAEVRVIVGNEWSWRNKHRVAQA